MKATSVCLLYAVTCLVASATFPALGAPARQPVASGQTAAQASGGVFTNCSACHGADGQGGFGPPFKGNPNLANTDYVLTMVLRGDGRMPAFGSQLSDQEIARVLTTIRTMWGNGAPAITPQAVAQMRVRLGKK